MCMMPDKTRYNYEMPLRSKTKIKNSLKITWLQMN